MTEVTYTSAGLKEIQHVAAHMREADRIEVAELGGMTPIEALTTSVRASGNRSRAVWYGGEPVAIHGEHRIALGNLSIIWLLGTDDLYKMRFTYIREAQRIINEARVAGRRLENVVHVDNTASIRMLKALGFSFGEPQVFGERGAMGMHFWIGA